MEFKQLQYFRVIAKERSISVAAEKLYITQPALSRSLKRLEDEVMTPLFVRKSNGVELTEAGEAFLAEIDQVFVHFERGLNNARMIAAQQRPRLAVSCSFEDFDDGLIEQIHHRFPDVQTSVDILPPTQALQELLSGRVDFALVPRQTAQAGVVYEHLLSEEMLLSAAEGHPLCGRGSVRPEELNGCTCVCNEVAFDWESIQQICQEHQIDMTLAFSSNNHQTAGRFRSLTGSVQFVQIGAVAATAPDDERRLIFPARIVPQVFHRHIYLAYHGSKRLSEADTCFLELIRSCFARKRRLLDQFAEQVFGPEDRKASP